MNVDFPVWMIDSLDKEATRPGVSCQSVIKVWLGERIEQRRLAEEGMNGEIETWPE